MDSTVGAGSGSGRKKDKPTDLVDFISSWSLQDIFNINLYGDNLYGLKTHVVKATLPQALRSMSSSMAKAAMSFGLGL